MARIYYDKDSNLRLLKGKKIAIIGYGSQGHGQAQNLRDSGLDVSIGVRSEGESYKLAVKDGFKPIPISEAAKKCDLIQILL
ncbi:MAG TPA: NAD(P)-binding domain-containing protein, partial [Candidatus Brocadiales bacterium]|nr:NAD(P)-binding domain-containing protein [Candidatus Brocadiales bacterium]